MPCWEDLEESDAMEMTVEQSVAKEDAAFRNNDFGESMRKPSILLEEGVRKTGKIKNPFSQKSKSIQHF